MGLRRLRIAVLVLLAWCGAALGDPTPGSRLRLRQVRFDSENPGLQPKLEPGMPIDATRARQIADEAREQLRLEGYADATVAAELVGAGTGRADLHLRVEKGRRYTIHAVDFSGPPALPLGELRKALRATRARRLLPPVPLWRDGWRLLPGYSPEAIAADRARLESLLFSRGYFEARVAEPQVMREGARVRVRFPLQPGPRYGVERLDLAGAAPQTGHEEFPAGAFCGWVHEQRRAAERQGILDFRVRLHVEPLAGQRAALAASIERGPAFRVGRIEFRGNHALRDADLRKALLLEEAAPFDPLRLRQSLARLNRSARLEPLDLDDVSVGRDAATRTVDLTLALREKHGRWSLSGPAGPLRWAGPLQFTLASRLPGWSVGPLDLATCFASFHLLALSRPLASWLPLPRRRLLPLFTLERPWLAGQRWTSGITIAPQLGWKGSGAVYAMGQSRNFLLERLEGNRAPEESAVTIERLGQAPAVLFCGPPRARLDWLRRPSAAAAGLLLSAPF